MWSEDAPDRGGWWWWKADPDSLVVPVFVNLTTLMAEFFDNDVYPPIHVDILGGFWTRTDPSYP